MLTRSNGNILRNPLLKGDDVSMAADAEQTTMKARADFFNTVPTCGTGLRGHEFKPIDVLVWRAHNGRGSAVVGLGLICAADISARVTATHRRMTHLHPSSFWSPYWKWMQDGAGIV